jgi:predicted aminopeptidase
MRQERSFAERNHCTGLALMLFLLLLQGCTSFTYVTQAAAGQVDLNRRARDIDQLVAEKRVDARMRRLLSQVAVIKSFGEKHGLATTRNYTKYVRIDRQAAVWVVSASDPLRFHSRTWSFPLVGSFTALGWFHLDEAKTFAAGLRQEGLDVDLRGAGAYSTAGFFEDPIVSTMIPRGKRALGELADVVLHEMTHATFFVKHQSTLNESVANFVGQKLADEYLSATLGAESEERAAYLSWEQAANERGRTLQAAYLTLEALYASDKPNADKLRDKAEVLLRVHELLHFKRPINNATLIQYRTYHSGQDELATLLGVCGDDWQRFVTALKRLESAHLTRSQTSDIGNMIEPLIEAHCPG